MRIFLFTVFVVAPCIALATSKKPKAAVPAVPAPASKSTAGKKHGSPLIDSDLGGRDLAFLANAVEVGSALRFLADQAEHTANPDLRGFGEDLVKSLAAQSSLLNIVAEMRKIKIGDGHSDTEGRIERKVAGLEGAKLEKALLDQFREIDRRALATYELGVTSQDPTIRKLCEQTLPQIRKHLAVVDAMAGIAPTRAPGEVAAPESSSPAATAAPAPVPDFPPVASGPARPDFRTNVRLSGEGSPATER